MLRISGVALAVVLVGLLLYWLSGPSNPRVPRAPGIAGLEQALNNANLNANAPMSGLLRRVRARMGDPDVGGGTSSIIKSAEPEIYTAMPGDGPVSDSGPGSVTELYPPTHVTYITTPVDDVPASKAPPSAPPRDDAPPTTRPPDQDEPVHPSSAGKGDRALDAAIEGGLGTPKSVPGQDR